MNLVKLNQRAFFNGDRRPDEFQNWKSAARQAGRQPREAGPGGDTPFFATTHKARPGVLTVPSTTLLVAACSLHPARCSPQIICRANYSFE
jgi:hypothetical protein